MTTTPPLSLTERLAARATANVMAAANQGSTIVQGMASTASDVTLMHSEPVASDIPDDEFYQGLGNLYAVPAFLLVGIKQVIVKGGVIKKPDANGVIATDDPYMINFLDHLVTSSGHVKRLPEKEQEPAK